MRLTPPSGIMLMLPTRWRKRKVARGETCMSAQENMTLARRFIEARVKADLDALDKMMTPDYVSHAKLLPDQQPDREGEKWVAAQFAAAFSNRRLLIEDQQASLPKEVPQLQGWQISPFYKPAREVGGDFYDFHLLSEE